MENLSMKKHRWDEKKALEDTQKTFKLKNKNSTRMNENKITNCDIFSLRIY